MENDLQFMNLSRQVKEYKGEFMKAIEAVVDEAAFAGGKYVKQFEGEFAEYIGTKYCSGLSSGTSALFMAMKALGIQSDDEVILPSNTFIASAWGAYYCGAKPVFVDITDDTWEIDPTKIEDKITSRTKAIIGVHLYGHPFDVDAVKQIADKRGLYLVEDCAQAHGTLYKGRKVGTFGDIGCFSFYPGKNLGAFGEAGAIVTDNEDYYKQIEIMKDHGSEIRYHHDMEGYNLRMDGINGAVLSIKLKYLDGWNQRRREIAGKYYTGIQNSKISFQTVAEYADPIWHLFEVEINNPGKFMSHMLSCGIVCGRHYPIPCHLQKVFSYLGYCEGSLPVSEYHSRHCVTLPMYPELSDGEVDLIIDSCNRYRG